MWAIFLAAIATDQASSQPVDDVSMLEEQEEQVVTVSRRAQKVSESSLAVEVITAEDIHRSGITYIPEILRRFAGMDVAQSAYGDFKVGIRGDIGRAYETDKVLLMVDGRSLMTEAFGTVWWNQVPVPVNLIERIEIVRGPMVTLFGGNALMGAVNIITKTAQQMSGVSYEAGVGATTPTAATPSLPVMRQRTASAWRSDDGRHSVRFGYDTSDYLFMATHQLKTPVSSALLGYELSPTKARHFRLTFNGSGNTRDYVRSTADRGLWQETNGDTMLAFEYADDNVAAGRATLLARATYRATYNVLPTKGVDLSGNALTVPAGLTQTGISEVVFNYAFSNQHKLTTGADLRYTGVNWSVFGPGGGQQIDASLFAQYQGRLFDRLTVDAALRGSVFGYPLAHVAPIWMLMPRGGLALRLAEGQALRGSIGYSQRAPYLYDLFSTYIPPYSLLGNPALKPEGLLGIDLGYALTQSSFDLSLAGFANVFDHLIERAASEPVQAVNSTNAWSVGGEAAVGWRPNENVRVRGNYSLALFYQRPSNVPYAAGPNHKGNVIVDVELPYGFTVNAAGGLVGPASTVAQQANTYPSLAAVTLPTRWYGDLTLGWSFAQGCTLQLIAANLARVGVTSLVEYAALGAQPVASRILVNFVYRSPPTGVSVDGERAWSDRWWVVLLWGVVGTALATAPLWIGALAGY